MTSRDFEKPKGAETPMLKAPFGGIPPKGTAVEGVLMYAKMRKGQKARNKEASLFLHKNRVRWGKGRGSRKKIGAAQQVLRGTKLG